MWREFEILGAYRESGEPARLYVEAATEADAADFAASKGVLISRILDRSADDQKEGKAQQAVPAPRKLATHESPDPPEDHRLRSGSRQAPGAVLLDGETVIATFDAKPGEVGLRGVIFGSKRRMTLTNQRLIVVERSLINANTTIVRLESIDGVRTAPHIWILLLILGSLLNASSLSLFVLSLLGAASMLALDSTGALGVTGSTTAAALISIGMIPLFAGLALTRAAFRRFAGVLVHGAPVGIYLRRLPGGRIEPFFTALSEAMAERGS